jgi:PHD/YefM family antitoxin component YafN of YafNO toxin-antitoxin module
MITMSATDAKNKIGELWDLADKEPVTIERNGTARYVVVPVGSYVAVSRAEYDRLLGYDSHPQRQIGFAAELLDGFDVDALLEVDLSDAMREYM